MDELTNMIQDLEYRLACWEEEYRTFGTGSTERTSSMSRKDLAFLAGKIDRLKRERKKLAELIELTEKQIDAYTANW